MMMMMMMPGSASACDAPQPKRKRVQEPLSAMKRRLAKHGDPRWPQEQCDSMTKKQLNEHLGELGLTKRQELTVSMEDYSPDLSWEELQELKQKRCTPHLLVVLARLLLHQDEFSGGGAPSLGGEV